MSAQELSDVTLALVDTDVLSCWESKVKLGLECSLLLKHSKGKVTTTLQFSAPTASSSDSQAVSVKKKKTKISAKQKRTKMNAKKLEALLAYQKRLVEERGLPPSRLMLLWKPPLLLLHLFQSLDRSVKRISSVNNVTSRQNPSVV